MYRSLCNVHDCGCVLLLGDCGRGENNSFYFLYFFLELKAVFRIPVACGLKIELSGSCTIKHVFDVLEVRKKKFSFALSNLANFYYLSIFGILNCQVRIAIHLIEPYLLNLIIVSSF